MMEGPKDDASFYGCIKALIEMFSVVALSVWSYRMITRTVEAVEGIRDAIQQPQEKGTEG
ncbi:MAG: hypothetical protein SPG40_05325 [Kiritimatiellia bacterium]|nr:hypothetical protein [Kiritimatiellia bacterium]